MDLKIPLAIRRLERPWACAEFAYASDAVSTGMNATWQRKMSSCYQPSR
jgi:hypothetical protein